MTQGDVAAWGFGGGRGPKSDIDPASRSEVGAGACDLHGDAGSVILMVMQVPPWYRQSCEIWGLAQGRGQVCRPISAENWVPKPGLIGA